MSHFFQTTKLKKTNRLTVAFAFAIFTAPTLANAATSKSYNVAVYRGQAGCPGCSEMVVKSLIGTGLPLHISYVGEKEKLKLNEQTLKKFDIYIQPGGGQDIPGSYEVIGDEGAEAIRQFVKNGKDFIGICMGAYLADKDWIGLIDAPLSQKWEDLIHVPGMREITPCKSNGIISKKLFTSRMAPISTTPPQAMGSRRSRITRMEI
jgi:hypothetical protein